VATLASVEGTSEHVFWVLNETAEHGDFKQDGDLIIQHYNVVVQIMGISRGTIVTKGVFLTINPIKQRDSASRTRGWGLSLSTIGYWSKAWHLVNPKIAGKWMFIPLELIIIGFDPPPIGN